MKAIATFILFFFNSPCTCNFFYREARKEREEIFKNLAFFALFAVHLFTYILEIFLVMNYRMRESTSNHFWAMTS